MTELGIGVVGMGWMGQVHARSYSLARQRFPECGLSARLVICSDVVPQRAEQARDLLGFEAATTCWRDVIERPDVQIVSIATPNNLHRQIVETATRGRQTHLLRKAGRSQSAGDSAD